MKLAAIAVAAVLSIVAVADPQSSRQPSCGTKKRIEPAAAAVDAVIAAYWDDGRSVFRKHKGKDEVLDYWLCAHAFDMLLDAAERWRRRDVLDKARRFFGGFKKVHPDWRRNDYNDDLLWWVIADCHAHPILKDSAVLNEAREIMGFIMDSQTDGELGGGVWWKSNERRGKHACSCYPAVIAANELYRITKDRKYLDYAVSVYAWSRDNLFDKNSGQVYDMKGVEGTVDRTCYTYNVGTCIGAALRLYTFTRRRQYLDDAILAAGFLMDSMSTGDMMRGRGQGDGGAFNGIAARYLGELARLPEGRRVGEYLKVNARGAWSHRRASDGLVGPDWDRTVGDSFDIEAQTACSAATLLLAAPKESFAPPPRGAVKVMTFNIRNSNGDRGGDNEWSKRRDEMVRIMKEIDADVFGLQEVLPDQREFLMSRFSDYEFVGEGRGSDRKSDESASIAFRKSRFRALNAGTFWLSETPDEPGKKGWGAACPRVCSYAVLEDKTTKKRFTFANTHTDHVSEVAREKGMLLIIERMKEFGKGSPIVFTGDHNCREQEKPAQSVSKILKNAMYVCDTIPLGPWRSFNGWEWRDRECSSAAAMKMPVHVRNARKGSPDADTSRNGGFVWEDCGGRIDYIYVTPGTRVLDYRTVSTPRLGTKRYTSDHFPVTATVVFR